MQGDPRVDILMNPVDAAIRRYVKNRDAATEVYNRAYEAVINSMDIIKTGKTYCAYCGAEYPLDDNAATQVGEHIKTCEKHPMRAVEARAEAAEAQAATLTREVSILRKAVEVAISDLSEAQGEWVLVDPLYAPEWTHPYKEISDRLEHAKMQQFVKGGEE